MIINKKAYPLVIYISVVLILLLLTMTLNFNLTGYSYDLDEQSNVMTIGEDFVKKEEYSLQDTVVPVLQVMVAINKANEMWLHTILIFSAFISVFFVFVYKPLRPRKNLKLHVGISHIISCRLYHLGLLRS